MITRLALARACGLTRWQSAANVMQHPASNMRAFRRAFISLAREPVAVTSAVDSREIQVAAARAAAASAVARMQQTESAAPSVDMPLSSTSEPRASPSTALENSTFMGMSPDFPCLQREQLRNNVVAEPTYDNVVSGYEIFQSNEPFQCEWGGVLPEVSVAYETWGELNADKSNAILIHTGLSASSHAKSHAKNPRAGWWEKFIGPGLAVDTDKFFVVCTNVLGGCYGTTGPASVNPTTGDAYAMTFPLITVRDMIDVQLRLLDSLGIATLHASVGASLGGMQSLQLAARAPHRTRRLVSISAAARSHPLSIAVRHLQRKSLMTDPKWNHGNYYGQAHPHAGMKLARQLATIYYRSGPEWEMRFANDRINPSAAPSFCPDFLIESYIDHQGEQFCLQYDPNSLLYISKAMDIFDLGKSSADPQGAYSLESGLKDVMMPTLVLGVESDLLFPAFQQREISKILRNLGNPHVTYYELDALYGHDTFLIDVASVGNAVKGHLETSL